MGSSLYDLEQAKQAEKDMLAQQRAEAMARAKAQGTQFGTQQKKDAEAMAAFRRETGLDPNMAANQFMGPMSAAIRARQNQPVNAQNQFLPANFQLMPPSPSAQDASAYSEIVDIEDAGNQEAMETGTDMRDSMDVEPTEDGEESEVSREQLLSFAASAGRKNMQQQTQDNTQQSRLQFTRERLE